MRLDGPSWTPTNAEVRLAPKSLTAVYLPLLKVSVALRYALTFPCTPEAGQEARQNLPWLLAEQSGIRKAGRFT